MTRIPYLLLELDYRYYRILSVIRCIFLLPQVNAVVRKETELKKYVKIQDFKQLKDN